MRLRRISLRSFRGVDACDVELLEAGQQTGVVVVQGPNEIGKTSLAEAIDVLWQYPHSSRHRAVRDLQPVGRDVGTHVEVEVEADEVAFTYAKTWNRDAGAELRITSPAPQQLTGKEAHERADALLADMVDPGLWKALRVPQGVVDQPDVAAAPALVAALSRAGGGAVVDNRDLAIGELVRAERGRWRTETGRDRRPVRDAHAAYAAARQEHAEAQAVVAAVRADLEAVERLEAEIACARADLDDARIAQRASHAAATAADELERRVDVLDRQRDQAAAALRDAQRLADERRTLHDEVQRATAMLTDARRAASADDGVHSAVRRAEDARAERDRAAAQRRAARTAAQSARADLQAVLMRRQLADLTAVLRGADDARARARAAEQALGDEPVDASVVTTVRDLDLQARAAAVALRAGAPQVQVRPAHGVVATVTDARATTDLSATSTPYSAQADGRVVVEVPDVVTVLVEPGGGVESLRSAAQEAADVVHETLAQLGCADLAAVEARADARRRALDDLTSAHADERRLLGDETREALEERVRWLAQECAGVMQVHADAAPSSDELSTARLRVAEAESDASTADDRVGEVDAQLEAALDELERRRSKREERRLALERASGTLEHVSARLDQARAITADDVLTAAEATARGAWERAEAAATVARADLEAAGVDAARLRRDAADDAVEAVQRELAESRRELSIRRAQVAARADDGPAGRMAAAEARLDAARAARDEAVACADAATLLEETFARHRDAHRRRWAAPLAEEIERLGRVLWGPDLRIDLDDDLRVATRTVDGTTLGFDALSHGAREQLALIVRLACAVVVGRGGAPVIVDDALGFSDPDRLRRMGAVLALAGRSCQIVLLTCHPQRYRQVPGARTIRLGDPRSTGLAA